jgi:hypothetical protein
VAVLVSRINDEVGGTRELEGERERRACGMLRLDGERF